MKYSSEQIMLPAPFLGYYTLFFRKPYLTKAHRHSSWQLSATLDGTFFYHINGAEIRLGPGEWILISPELMHDVGSRSPSSWAMQIFFRHFPPDLLPEAAQIFNLRRSFFRRGKVPVRRLLELQKTIRSEHLRGSSFMRGNCNVKVLDFVTLLLSSIPEKELPEQEPCPELLKVVEFMEEHYADPVGVEDFAAAAGKSVRRFNEFFQQTLKTTPLHFFHTVRLGHAQEMLIRGAGIAETAGACGFTTPQYFCRFFRRATGMTPADFRREPFYK